MSGSTRYYTAVVLMHKLTNQMTGQEETYTVNSRLCLCLQLKEHFYNHDSFLPQLLDIPTSVAS